MKSNNLFICGFVILLGLFSSCEIVQEIRFDADGSGKYTFEIDMSEMTGMGRDSSSDSSNKQLDTLIKFSDFLALKKDSIKKLDKADRKKLEGLAAYDMYIKADTLSKQMKMRLGYVFTDLEDLNRFAEKLEGVEVKELEQFKQQLKGNQAPDTSAVKKPDLLNFNAYFVTAFSKTKFSRRISDEMIQMFEEKKDTTMTKDNPMSNMIRFKQRYIFPYRIIKVDGGNPEKIKILSDFKSVEVEGNVYDISTDPRVFDLEVEFENE